MTGRLLPGLIAALAVAAPPAGAATAVALPAAGPVISERPAVVRAAPRAGARVVARLSAFRPDFRRRIVYVTSARADAEGRPWLLVDVPGRPNGRRGWLRAEAVDVRPVRRRIVVILRTRTLRVLEGRRVLLTGRVAIGAPATPTPTGRFYVTAAFRPSSAFLGAFALETSAYARVSEWPGGGVVGIHGTPQPELLGQAVSHGCIRVHDRTARRLRALAPPGTTVEVRA